MSNADDSDRSLAGVPVRREHTNHDCYPMPETLEAVLERAEDLRDEKCDCTEEYLSYYRSARRGGMGAESDDEGADAALDRFHSVIEDYRWETARSRCA